MSTYSLGLIMDSIWNRIPDGDALRRMNPYSMPNPHDMLLSAGKKVVEICAKEGALLFAPLSKEDDQNAWYRLVGAWVFFFKTHETQSRAKVADDLGINASNLTNFLNGKRPLTSKALLGIAKYMDIQPYDIRPELGARSADQQHRSHCKQMLSVKRGLKDIEQGIQLLAANGVVVDHLLAKVGSVMSRLEA